MTDFARKRLWTAAGRMGLVSGPSNPPKNRGLGSRSNAATGGFIVIVFPGDAIPCSAACGSLTSSFRFGLRQKVEEPDSPAVPLHGEEDHLPFPDRDRDLWIGR